MLARLSYASAGATTLWADPSTSYYSGAQETFSTNTTSFTNTYPQTNGIMY
ncbi:hypothetical protein [Cellulomonas sp. KRMCY2]|uniref:hypothetical protein n=1 Tax=Cellulomonas sp. KRMCY2 TaxID=1304865 RepID=UPI0004BC3FCF|nr:hypothetical protein [Cellulomonas sp. KRMCY2]